MSKKLLRSIFIALFATFAMLCWIMAGRTTDDSLVSFWGILLCLFSLFGGGFIGLVVAELIVILKG